MIRSGLRQKGVPIAALLLALGTFGLQGIPAHAYLDDGDQNPPGEVGLGFKDKGPGELPHRGDGGGSGGGTETRRADPDDLSFNNPRVSVPVVPAQAPVRQAWMGILRLWLERLAAYFIIIR